MSRYFSHLALAVVAMPMMLAGAVAVADDDRGRVYSVTVTNITNAQQFTPLLVATHRKGVKVFALGSAASAQLATLAEEGDTAPLTALLSSDPKVNEVTTTGPLLDPGASRTVYIAARRNFDHISLAAMLIPTNDGFIAINGVEAPDDHRTLTIYSPAYDAGSEVNDELCASIPGPSFVECGGPGGGGMPVGGEEGYVHIHRGFHGVGDFNAAARDWRNPVAQIVIRRVGKGLGR